MQFPNNTKSFSQNSKTDNEQSKAKHSGMMRYGMMLCCAVMLLPVGLYFLGGGALSSLSSNVGLFLPLGLCLGMHFVMHRMMGKSCHGEKHDEKKEIEQLEAVEVLPPETSR